MKRAFSIAAALAAVAVIAAPPAVSGGPVTKQNGKAPVFTAFTSICSMPAFLHYGNCGGNAETYTQVRGRVDAVQPKRGEWNLSLEFRNLEPGRWYRLWGNRSGATPVPGIVQGFFVIGTVTAGADGSARFDYQTGEPADLGFDLNVLSGPTDLFGITVVTSWWSQQTLQVLDVAGNLYVPSA